MSDNLKDVMDSTIESIKSMVDVDSVVGSPIKVGDNVIIIPISKISYGFGAGGSDLKNKEQSDIFRFGGGCGTGVTISPVGFLSVVNDNVTFLQVESFHGALDRLISMTPEVINKISSVLKKRKEKKIQSP